MKTLLLASLLLFSTASVEAHEAALGWEYGWECCAGHDCFQETTDEVREQYDGYYIVLTAELIPYKDKRIKMSKDEFFHRCTRFGNPEAKRSICLYVPNRGF